LPEDARALKPRLNPNQPPQQRLSPPQGLELIQYIEILTERGLQPTKEMVRRFASEIAKEHIAKGWVTCFINRHWTVGMDYTRHKADSEATYKLQDGGVQYPAWKHIQHG
jgi:hypothetical protein